MSKPTTSVGVPQAGTELALRFAYWDLFGQARPSCLPYIALTCIHIQEARSNNCSWRNPTPLHISTLYKSHEWACHMTSSTAVVFRHHCTICVTHYTALNQLMLMHFSRIRTLPLGSWRAPFLYIKYVASPVGESREIALSGKGQAGYRKWLWGRHQKVLHGYVSSRHHQAAPNGNSLAKKRMHNEKSIHFPASVGAQDDDIKGALLWLQAARELKDVSWKGFDPGRLENVTTKWTNGWNAQSSNPPKCKLLGLWDGSEKACQGPKKQLFGARVLFFGIRLQKFQEQSFGSMRRFQTKTFPPAKRFSWFFLWNRQTWLGRLLWIRITARRSRAALKLLKAVPTFTMTFSRGSGPQNEHATLPSRLVTQALCWKNWAITTPEIQHLRAVVRTTMHSHASP